MTMMQQLLYGTKQSQNMYGFHVFLLNRKCFSGNFESIFSDASHKAARDKEDFDGIVSVSHEYPQGGLTAKVLSRKRFALYNYTVY